MIIHWKSKFYENYMLSTQFLLTRSLQNFAHAMKAVFCIDHFVTIWFISNQSFHLIWIKMGSHNGTGPRSSLRSFAPCPTCDHPILLKLEQVKVPTTKRASQAFYTDNVSEINILKPKTSPVKAGSLWDVTYSVLILSDFFNNKQDCCILDIIKTEFDWKTALWQSVILQFTVLK